MVDEPTTARVRRGYERGIFDFSRVFKCHWRGLFGANNLTYRTRDELKNSNLKVQPRSSTQKFNQKNRGMSCVMSW